ncbi:hypothetical protein F5B17DRAFT_385506 [Nemania serpens]|nr:hypothetical protein F5B17DRAFT_385506 [Nemania serpens]
MVPRPLHASVVVFLAPWLLLALSPLTTATSLTPTFTPADSAPAPRSPFAPRLLNRRDGAALSDSAKAGVSVGVTLAAILIVGSITIFCVKRGRSRALARPETRTDGLDDVVEDANRVGGESPDKGKELYYMSTTSPTHEGMSVSPQPPGPAPDGFVFHNNGGYPTMPEQMYSPQQPSHAVSYYTPYSPDTYAYSGTGYPGYQGSAIADSSQQSGHAGPSSAHYPPEVHLQPQHQQQQYQQGGHSSWTYSLSATSPTPESPGPAQDVQYQYLQDHHQYQQTQSPSPDPSPHPNYYHHHNHNHHQDQQQQHQSAELSSGHEHEHGYYGRGGRGEDAYSPVPPPHPHASELPDQRPPVELMGEGHYSEVP